MKYYIAFNEMTLGRKEFASKDEAIAYIQQQIRLWLEGRHYAAKPTFKLIEAEVLERY